ncbi:hypothetical protein TESG_00291 [Trichophyton tonsurans CBS 112818]|uniref:Uncharacterized protein n=1 Tax=Trichophyton tonsurans (strain CBS 112818) TaxID=647933 RepID=F2RN22_TRIT1|nr:hypothetical protein TESG_00291 [Trichophyton tonsurans CBS 112818]
MQTVLGEYVSIHEDGRSCHPSSSWGRGGGFWVKQAGKKNKKDSSSRIRATDGMCLGVCDKEGGRFRIDVSFAGQSKRETRGREQREEGGRRRARAEAPGQKKGRKERETRQERDREREKVREEEEEEEEEGEGEEEERGRYVGDDDGGWKVRRRDQQQKKKKVDFLWGSIKGKRKNKNKNKNKNKGTQRYRSGHGNTV